MNLLVLIIAIVLIAMIAKAILESVKYVFGFEDIASWIIAICVATLAVIGIFSSIEGEVGAILLPYAALGVSVLLAPFLGLISKIWFKLRFFRKSCSYPEREINQDKNPPEIYEDTAERYRYNKVKDDRTKN